MKQDIEQYIKGCAACQANKINAHPLKPTIIPIMPSEGLPFQTVAMDFITKLPKSGKYDTILTITDHDCTKAAIFIPCQETIMAEGVATLYLRWVYPRDGIPAKVITDLIQGSHQNLPKDYATRYRSSRTYQRPTTHRPMANQKEPTSSLKCTSTSIAKRSKTIGTSGCHSQSLPTISGQMRQPRRPPSSSSWDTPRSSNGTSCHHKSQRWRRG